MRRVLPLLVLLGFALPALAQPSIIRLVTDAEHERLVAAIPTTDDPAMEQLRADPRLIVYGDREVPPVFQAANNGTLGVFRAGTLFSVGGVNVGVGSNRFPWKAPAGLDDAVGWTSFGFLWLPPGEQIAVARARLPADAQSAQFFSWTFPEGTVLGEVFLLTGDPSRPAWEMRVRRKVSSDVNTKPTMSVVRSSWSPTVFRPFADREELDEAVAFSGSPSTERFLSTKDRGHWQFKTEPLPNKLLRGDAVKDFLPPLDRQTVLRLLSREFTSVRDREWVPGGLAPDTHADFHVIPRGYNGAMLPVSQSTCASCHRTAGQNIRLFGLSSPQGWDEWVRGNVGDESFRFHPFDPASVSSDRNFRQVRLNPKLVSVLRVLQ